MAEVADVQLEREPAPAAAPSEDDERPSEEHAALRSERDFLLCSIKDLHHELASGELSEAQYQRLMDTYTAQAAQVLRRLESGEVAEPPPPASGPRWRVPLIGLGLVGLAAVAGLLLASSMGLRAPGATVTGNDQSGVDPRRATLERAVQQRPDDPLARIAYARFLLSAGEPVEALRQFDAAARLDPANAEALAYGGWIVFLGGLADDALARLDAAVARQPDYPDAHFFRGMVLLRGKGDRAAAADELQAYLDLASQSPLSEQVRGVLAELEPVPGESG